MLQHKSVMPFRQKFGNSKKEFAFFVTDRKQPHQLFICIFLFQKISEKRLKIRKSFLSNRMQQHTLHAFGKLCPLHADQVRIQKQLPRCQSGTFSTFLVVTRVEKIENSGENSNLEDLLTKLSICLFIFKYTNTYSIIKKIQQFFIILSNQVVKFWSIFFL